MEGVPWQESGDRVLSCLRKMEPTYQGPTSESSNLGGSVGVEPDRSQDPFSTMTRDLAPPPAQGQVHRKPFSRLCPTDTLRPPTGTLRPIHRGHCSLKGAFTLCFFSSLMAFWVAFCSCTQSCWYRCCSRSGKGVEGLQGRSPDMPEVMEGLRPLSEGGTSCLSGLQDKPLPPRL